MRALEANVLSSAWADEPTDGAAVASTEVALLDIGERDHLIQPKTAITERSKLNGERLLRCFAVDGLADQVGMTVMTGAFIDHVVEHSVQRVLTAGTRMGARLALHNAGGLE